MLKIISKILSLLTPTVISPEISIRIKRDQKLFISFIAITIIILTGFTILDLAMGIWIPTFVNGTGLILLIALAYFHKRTARVKQSFFYYILIAMLVITSQLLISSSNLSGNIVWFSILVLLAAIILPTKDTIILTASGVIFLSCAFIIPHHYPDFPRVIYSPHEALYINIAMFICAAFSAVIVGKVTISEEQHIQDWFKNQKNYFENLNHNNAALTSMISHDIANPLMVTMLALKKLNKEDPVVMKIEKQLTKIGSTIENLRQLKALSSGKLALSLEKIDLRSMCEECIRNLTAKATEKNISLLLTSDPKKEYLVSAEKTSLEASVICNLLTNAIKFSSRNQKVDIALDVTQDGTLLSVQDYGIGMPPDLVNNIFDFSEHTTRSGTEGEAGTGFGLPIIKMFTDIYSATIKVSSSEKAPSGTKFTINFPHA